MHDVLTIAGFAIMAAVLISASAQDIRSREVSDAHWVLMGITGIIIMVVRMFDGIVSIERIMVCAGTVMIIADILYDRKCPRHLDILFYAVLATMFVIPLTVSADDIFIGTSLVIPACYLVFAGMFYAGVLKGGADVKCLISLAIVFPVYPEMLGYPVIGIPSSVMPLIMPFPTAVLLVASIFSVSAMVFVIVKNIMRGDTEFPNMLLGYTMNSRDARDSHVWIMDKTNIGNTCHNDRIWVTPKIPFIVPLTAAAIFTALAGNPMFLLT